MAALLEPVLILIVSFGIPLGLLPADVLSYEGLLEIMRHPLVKLATFGVLFLVLWHAAHRMRITAHDLGIRNDRLVLLALYGIAAVGTLLLLAAVFRI